MPVSTMPAMPPSAMSPSTMHEDVHAAAQRQQCRDGEQLDRYGGAILVDQSSDQAGQECDQRPGSAIVAASGR
ncbi:hypothetical protein C7T96_11630 [Nitratireductor sp. StC3]|nr:hypothetical protein C7T96_11630 [Nitratireductor sp. StC3]